MAVHGCGGDGGYDEDIRDDNSDLFGTSVGTAAAATGNTRTSSTNLCTCSSNSKELPSLDNLDRFALHHARAVEQSFLLSPPKTFCAAEKRLMSTSGMMPAVAASFAAVS